ncbi:hypothetical protein YUWDRAFT_06820 [Streptomyces sp. AmelKG-D3]|nr:hypothetical protein YUWDRAFT_06820 [Streptomyces sp. AmelKG-D3]
MTLRSLFKPVYALALVLATFFTLSGTASASPLETVGLSSASESPVVKMAAQDGSLSASAAPTTCNWTGASITGAPTFATEAPNQLVSLAWTGNISASCTGGSPVNISTSIQVTDPQGVPHLVASGGAVPVNSGYTCNQAVTNCAGGWTAKFTITFSATKPGTTWPGSSQCTPSGSVQTCTVGGSAGVVPAVKVPAHTNCPKVARTAFSADVPCYNLPPSGEVPLLVLRTLKNIRETHFQGGAKADETKGLFYSKLTNNDLQKVWETGMQDKGAWKLNGSNYYEKTFPYEGAGIQSPKFGNGAPATKVTLVVERYGDGQYSEVVTMYPATG